MRLFCVVPFSRPKMLSNIVANLRRQRYRDFKVIVVENGDALSAWRDTSLMASVLQLRGPPHQADAKNLALSKMHPGDIFVTIDDDDEYRSGYLERVANCFLNGACMVGQREFATVLTDNSRWIAQCAHVHGPTFSFRIPSTPIMFDRSFADEVLMQHDLTELGYTLTEMPATPIEFVYRRQKSSVFACEDTEFVERLNARKYSEETWQI